MPAFTAIDCPSASAETVFVNGARVELVSRVATHPLPAAAIAAAKAKAALDVLPPGYPAIAVTHVANGKVTQA